MLQSLGDIAYHHHRLSAPPSQ